MHFPAFWSCRAVSKKEDDGMKAIFEGKILTVPNLLSFLRLCMVPLFLWIYLGLDEPLWAAGLLVLSGITDTVDGWIARIIHQESNLGKALDPFADKVTQIAVVTCLSIRFPRLWIVSGVLLAKESFALITGLVFRRTKKAVPAAICGELAMAAVYFAYEGLVLGFGLGAAVEIPGNPMQGALGVASGAALYYALRRVLEIQKLASSKESKKEAQASLLLRFIPSLLPAARLRFAVRGTAPHRHTALPGKACLRGTRLRFSSAALPSPGSFLQTDRKTHHKTTAIPDRQARRPSSDGWLRSEAPA